jgi:hypothetical protein
VQPQVAQAHVGAFRPVITNGGVHPPELVADMSMTDLLDKDSNPVKGAHIRQNLVELYAEAHRVVRILFQLVADEKGIADREVLKRAIIQILTRDFNTLLDIERQLFKEK